MNTDKLKVLLLGGTGAMGIHLTHILAERGFEVYVTSRKKRVSNNSNIRYLEGNAMDTSFVLNLLKSNNFYGMVDFMLYFRNEEFASKVTQYLQYVKQYVYISSARVYADSPQPLIESSKRLLDVSTDNDFLSFNEYALRKARQEDILKHSGKTNWTIIRPYITFSENRFQLGVLEKEDWLHRVLSGRTLVFSKDMLDKKTTLTYGYNVAEGIAAIVGKTEALGNVFHITNSKSYTWKEIYDAYIKVLTQYMGAEVKVKFLTRAINYDNKYSKYQVIYDRYFNREFDNSKINKFCDTNKFVPTLEGLEQCMLTFCKNPSYTILNPYREALLDKLTKEVATPKDFPSYKIWVKYIVCRFFISSNILKKL